MDTQPGLNETSVEPEKENRVFVPEVMAEPEAPVPVSASDEDAMIEESVQFINRTVAQMVFGASIIIGDHLLTRYFGGDIELAMSKAHNKPVSFNRLCRRPDISLTSRMLGGMVRVAAQERYFQGIGLDAGRLHYTHKLLLTRLPNDGAKSELAFDCMRENLPSRKLALRVNELIRISNPPPAITSESIIGQYAKAVEQFLDKTMMPEFLADKDNLYGLEREIQERLRRQAVEWLEEMEARRAACADLIIRLDDVIAHPNV
ncbi:MAG: hypothetical protein C4518_04060 [Desulfobacteraceae bacterium]|nr:MAG: hypothetical protein C4518_04060 [Desulfobacteraceae bacterium]